MSNTPINIDTSKTDYTERLIQQGLMALRIMPHMLETLETKSDAISKEVVRRYKAQS